MSASNLIVGFPLTGNSPRAQQFFDRLALPPTHAREKQYRTFIDSLYDAGVWAKLDALYVFAALNEAAALTNLVSPNYRAIIRGSAVAIATDTSLNVTTGAVETNFNPATAIAPHYTRNDAMIFVIATSTVQSNAWLAGHWEGAGVVAHSSRITPWRDNTTFFTINTDTPATKTHDSTMAGFFLAQRTAPNAQELFRDNVSLLSSAGASTGLPNGTIRLATGPVNIAGCMIGSSLNNAERTAADTIWRTYLAAVAP